MIIGIWRTKSNKLLMTLDDTDPWTKLLMQVFRKYEQLKQVTIKEIRSGACTNLNDQACKCCVDWGCTKECRCHPLDLPEG